MIFTEGKTGNVADITLGDKATDILDLDWFDANKTTLRKRTRSGQEIGIRKDSAPLQDGDIIYNENDKVIIINILPCACIILKPKNFRDMATICFEIGNKHIPVFITEIGEVLVEFEQPLYRILERAGYQPLRAERKLLKTHALVVRKHENVLNKTITIR